MSNLSSKTSDINIQHPEQWTLQIALHARVMRYTLVNKAHDDSLIAGEIPLDPSLAGSYLKAVQNAVYDNSLLLDDYGCMRILIDSPHFLLLPGDTQDEDEADQMMRTMFPELQGDTAVCALHGCGVNLAFEVSTDLLSFLQRTFVMPTIFHHLYPLCEHYVQFCKGSGVSRMFLNFHDNMMDMVVFDRGALNMANTFQIRNASDAAFMALHAWQSLSMDVHNDELQLTGDKLMRDEVTPLLRRYISYVMPAIFPAAALRLSHDATRAPFNLITLALCE